MDERYAILYLTRSPRDSLFGEGAEIQVGNHHNRPVRNNV